MHEKVLLDHTILCITHILSVRICWVTGITARTCLVKDKSNLNPLNCGPLIIWLISGLDQRQTYINQCFEWTGNRHHQPEVQVHSHPHPWHSALDKSRLLVKDKSPLSIPLAGLESATLYMSVALENVTYDQWSNIPMKIGYIGYMCWKHLVSPCSDYKYLKSRKAGQSQPDQKSRTT